MWKWKRRKKKKTKRAEVTVINTYKDEGGRGMVAIGGKGEDVR